MGIRTAHYHPKVVVSLALLIAGLFACSTVPPAAPPETPAPARPSAVYLQVVAHEDDDILFMNPDLANAVRGGAPTVTVYLTAGESDVPDAAGYAAGRQRGARAAYARMAGAPDEWRAEPLTVSGAQVELYTMTARPEIQLVFVNLPDDNDPRAAGGKRALSRLWRDRGDRLVLQALTPTGGVQRQQAYRRGDVVRLLAGLLERYRPTLVRAQDTQPDTRYTAGWQPYHDHPDHVITARLTNEAVRAYRAGGGNPRLVQTNYRDYNIEEAPVNLPAAQQQEKVDLFATYGRHDPLVFYTGPYDAWPRRMYHRWPLGTSWVARDAGDRLQAFLVQAGELLTWWQEPDGGWTGPASLGDAGGMLAPSVSVARDGAGLLRVFARRLDADEVVTIAQGAAGSPRSWSPRWESLGSPNLAGQPGFGAPVAVSGAGGRLTVLVRNASGGVSGRAQLAEGGWQPGWVRLGGSDVQDGLAAASTVDGQVELFAATRQGLHRWRRSTVDGPFAAGALPGESPSGPPVLAGEPPRVFYRQAGSTEVWTAGSRAVPGPTGAGGLAALAVGPDVLLWARSSTGSVIMAKAGADGWTDLGGADLVETPVAVRDARGLIMLLGERGDGRLVVNRQRPGSPEGAPAFAGWEPAGG